MLVGWTHDDFVDDTTNSLISDAAGVLIQTSATGGGAPPPTPVSSAPSTSPASEPVAPSTPSPAAGTQTAAPVAAPVGSSCEAAESFQITSTDLPNIQGCFQATEESYATGPIAIWTGSGAFDFNEIWIIGLADDGTGEYVSQSVTCRKSRHVLVPAFHYSRTVGPQRVPCLIRLTETSPMCPKPIISLQLFVPCRRLAVLYLSIASQDDSPWSIVLAAEDEDKRVLYCWSVEDSITVHPADATWECKNPDIRHRVVIEHCSRD